MFLELVVVPKRVYDGLVLCPDVYGQHYLFFKFCFADRAVIL